MRSSWLSLGSLLPQVLSLTLPYTTPNCSSFHNSIDFGKYDATYLNNTYYNAGGLNVSGTFNSFSFCEIYVAIDYTPGAHLVSVLWLPDYEQYQDRFVAVGNGGLAGTIYFWDMMAQLNSGMGFAVASGNAGHNAYIETNGTNAGSPGLYIPYMHNEAEMKAWIHNAISLFTPLAKEMTALYYGREPKYMYYSGCPTGGAQGFALAQYHAEMYDGIFAGSPGNYWDHLTLGALWNQQHFAANGGAGNFSQAALNFTTNAVLDACDELDGVKDRLLENPLDCRFDISTLECKNNSDLVSKDGKVTCLTAAQIEAARAVYSGPITSDTGKEIYPGWVLGSEIQWAQIQEQGGANGYAIPMLQNIVYNNTNWDPSTFGWTSKEVQVVDERAGRLINAISPDLTAFKARQGKMLTTQGWADQYVAPIWPIQHYEQLQNAMKRGEDISDFYSLFMVPGGGHCGAGEYYPQAPGVWHVMPALVNWVERGVKPQTVLATDPADGSGRTRKLCPYPATARFVGVSSNDFNSYVCE